MTSQLKAYIVQSKNKDLMNKSSSGGAFAELARYVLDQNGVVFGCMMERVEKGFDVIHICINKKEDLYKLQGSKYVQSTLGKTIKQAKDFLDNGIKVLFSGTPCQIAALKAFLKCDYENLLTMDMSCTGTPSLKIFNDYINFLENKYKRKISGFEFRNKEKMGWKCGNALITFDDSSQIIIPVDKSSYLSLFLSKKIQNKSCQNCIYNGLKRVSDITVADAWGIDKEFPELLNIFNADNGISLVLANSQKGNKIFELLKSNLMYTSVNIYNMIKYNNPLMKKPEVTPDLNFLSEYQKHGYYAVEKLFKKVQKRQRRHQFIIKFLPTFIKKWIKANRKTDCILLTMFGYPNYGSLLTAYALQKTIENLGYDSKIIKYCDLYGYNKDFAKKYLKLTKRCNIYSEYKSLNKLSKTFILGSDNLINYKDGNITDVAHSLLNFITSSNKKMMIAGSIGSWDGTTKTEEDSKYIKYLLSKFDYVSTREEHGKNVLKNIFDCNADWINDPVLFLDKQEYIDLAKNVKNDYDGKIMEYVLYPDEEKQGIVNYYKEKLNKKVVKFMANTQNVNKYTKCENKKVENWLSAIINSDLIITDSFHCVLYSLIFNKRFICIKNTHNTVRFISLFNCLDINIPMITNIKDIENFEFSYDYEAVNKKINNIRYYALEKISENLAKPKTEKKEQTKMEKYNELFLISQIPWYQKNRIFYYGFIKLFVSPIKRIIRFLRKPF